MSKIHSILSDPQLVETGIAEHRRYEAGEAIITEGSDGRCVYLIRTGSVCRTH